jgi:hypothetical protein
MGEYNCFSMPLLYVPVPHIKYGIKRGRRRNEYYGRNNLIAVPEKTNPPVMHLVGQDLTLDCPLLLYFHLLKTLFPIQVRFL